MAGVSERLNATLRAERKSSRFFTTAAVSEILQHALLVLQWWCLAVVIDETMTRSRWPIVFTALGGMCVIYILRLAAQVVATRMTDAGRLAATEGLRRQFAPIIVARAGRALPPGHAADALMDATDVIARYKAASVPLRIAGAPSTLILLAAVALAHWPIALLLALCTLLLPLNLKLSGQVGLDAGQQELAESRRLSSIVRESVHGMPTLLSLGAVKTQRDRLRRASDRWGEATRRVLRFAFLSGVVMDVAVTMAIAVSATYAGLVLLGFLHIPGAPPLSLGTALFCLLLCPVYFAPSQRAARGFHDRDDAEVAALALHEATEESAAGEGDQVQGPSDESSDVAPTVHFHEVTHVLGERPIVEDFTLTARAGQWTALSGPSGVGKTTILRLASGASRPTSGEVTWDGASHPPAYGWLGAQTIILEATVRENIALHNRELSDEDIISALEVAGADRLLRSLEHGLDTRLGPDARTISAGERRRIAIARIVAARRPLWILDEPTAHLDATTEEAILRTLRRASAGCTVLIATHSAAVNACADRAVEIQAGAAVPSIALDRL